MLAVNFNPFPVLSTERLTLRQVGEQDVNEIFFFRSDESVLKYINRKPAETTEEAADFIKKLQDFAMTNEGITWAITFKDEPALIGTICYWNIEPENYRAEIGYQLHPDFQGRGIMREAMAAIIDYGFKKMDLHTITAIVNPDNAASIKLLEQSHFIKEGYFNENYFYDGKFFDSAIYCLINK